MLPSIRHLLKESDPADGPQESLSSTSSSSSSSTAITANTASSSTTTTITITAQPPSSSSSTTATITAMPSTFYPSHFHDPASQSDSLKTPRHPQRQQQQQQQQHRSYSPHPQPHQRSPPYDDSSRTRHSDQEDRYPPSYEQAPSRSSLSYNPPPHTSYPTKDRIDPRRDDPRNFGSAPDWNSRQSGHLNAHSSNIPQRPNSSSAYRPQRSSPFDPSVASSTSSTSPSPSIASVTAASTPLTTEAIAAVTNGTAAASISDPRARFSQSQDLSRLASAAEDLRHSTTEQNDGNSGRRSSPSGGLVQSATPRWSSQQRSIPSFDPSRHPDGGTHGQRHLPSNADDYYAPQPEYSRRMPPPSVSPTPLSKDPRPVPRDDYSQSSVSPPSQSRAPPRPTKQVNHSREWSDPQPLQDYRDEPQDKRRHPPESFDHHSENLQYSSPPPPPHYHSQHPSLQHEQHEQPVYDPVRASDQRPQPRTQRLSSSYPPHQDRQEYPPQRHQQHQRFATADPATSMPYEQSTAPPRQQQQNSQKHGLATRSERIASPGPSHPYYTQNHPPRSSHAQTEPDRGSHPRHEAPPGRYPSPPQARSFGFPQVPPGEQDHHHSKSDCRQEYDSRRPDPPSERENLNGMHGSGSWSDGGGHGPEARAMMNRRHGHGLSESMPFVPSSQDPSSSKWKESQRPIRPSFSMSDLARTESGYARRDRQSMVDHEERDEDEGEYEEEEEEDPEGQEAAFVEEEAPRRPEVSRLSFQHLARPGSQSQPPRSAPPPTPPQHVHSGPSTHDDQVWSRSSGYDEYEYDYDPRSDPRAGAQNASGPGPTVTTPTGHDPRHHGGAQYSHHHRHPSHEYGPPPPQPHHYPHPNQRAQQPYPPSMQHPRQPHGQQPYPHPPQHHYQQHSSQHHSRQAYQYGSHPPQVIMPHHLSGDGSMSGGGVGNRSTPTRRGPYLSRQRALLAGLESTSPSSRYQCQYCHKQFSRPSSLRIHTYSHTGERPFKCSEEGCGRQFSVQSNMRRHLRVHRLGRMRADFGSLDQD